MTTKSQCSMFRLSTRVKALSLMRLSDSLLYSIRLIAPKVLIWKVLAWASTFARRLSTKTMEQLVSTLKEKIKALHSNLQ